MNKIKALLVALIMAFAMFAAPSAQAADPLIFWVQTNTGRITADRDQAIPRDRECDGNRVYFFLYESDAGGSAIKIYDANGCDTGGGKGLIPNRIDRAKFCEERDSGFDECTSAENIRK